MTLAIVVFFFALLGIVCLFTLKYWENRRARIVAPLIREKLDTRALQLKDLLVAARINLDKVPPEALRLSRIIIHEAALALAASARFAEVQAHRLADLVSYKHRFEKRETNSEFLEKVAEHKNGGEASEAGNATSELDEGTR